MLKKIRRAIVNPRRIFAWISFIINNLRVSKAVLDGKVFYKYKGGFYPEYLNTGNAISFIEDKAKQYCLGLGLDVGSDVWPFSSAIPIRNDEHQNAYNLENFENASLDYVISSHCLEHLEKWQDALKLWISKLKINGIIFLYLPHESNKLWHPNGPWGGLGHKWIPTYKILNEFLMNEGIKIIEYNRDRDVYWSFHVVGEKVR